MLKDKSSPLHTSKWPRPEWIFRRWKKAAGPALGRYIPAAPFAALATFGQPPFPSQPLLYDEIGQQLAVSLLQTLEGEAVLAGEAAFVIDLPGAASLALGFYLWQQSQKIAPVTLLNSYWRPGGVLDGQEIAPALAFYAEKLSSPESVASYAFLLERERGDEIDPLKLIDTFDNRYRVGTSLFPPLPELRAMGIQGLIDLRASSDKLPNDLADFYENASQAGLDIFQTIIA